MELFGILALAVVFLAIVLLHHSSTIKMTEATPQKIANKVKFMLIQGKTKFVIEHDYKGKKTINKHYDILFKRQDIINAICDLLPDDHININFVGNTVVINVIE